MKTPRYAAALLACVLGTTTLAAAPAEQAGKPNIIVILTDDHGYADLSSQRQLPDVRTPNIDALAARGIRATAGYVTAPQCSPSRAGLISGRYQQKFGLDTIPDDPMPLEVTTIPERLKKAGYVSGMVGKWHLDPNAVSLKWAREHVPNLKVNAGGRVNIPQRQVRQFSALAQGFDECYQGEMLNYFATFDLEGKSLDPHGTEIDNPNYRLDVQTDAALAFLKRHHGQPFFLYLAYYGPHVPLEATEKYLARFPGPMPERRRYALAMVSAIDDGVGRINAALKDYGIDDNTLIFFTSDNGAPLKNTMPDTKPLAVNGWDGSRNDPWVGEKGMLTDGGVRVPFLVSWPARLPAGKVYEQPVITLDIAATAAAVAGLPHDDGLDGVNLIPYLSGQVQGAPHDALYWRFWNQSAVRSGQWKYIQAGNAAKYLFDLSTDAPEKQNVIAEHPDVARALAAKLSSWTSGLKPPGDPDRPLNVQEKSWYAHFLGWREKK